MRLFHMGIKTAGTVLHVSSTMDLMRRVPGNICNFYEFCVFFAFITLNDLMNLLKEGIIFFLISWNAFMYFKESVIQDEKPLGYS